MVQLEHVSFSNHHIEVLSFLVSDVLNIAAKHLAVSHNNEVNGEATGLLR